MKLQCAPWIPSSVSANCNTVIEKCNISHPILQNDKEIEHVVKSIVVAAMYVAREECHGSHGHVACVLQPTALRKVICNKAFPPNKLQLICFATNVVKVDDKNKDEIDGYIEVSCPKLVSTYTVQARMPTLPISIDGTQSVIPFWLIQSVHAKAANLKRAVHEVTIGDATVRIPMFVNAVALNKGDTITIPSRK
jgi:hypothetical protein